MPQAPESKMKQDVHPGKKDYSSSIPCGHPDSHHGNRNRLALFLAPLWVPYHLAMVQGLGRPHLLLPLMMKSQGNTLLSMCTFPGQEIHVAGLPMGLKSTGTTVVSLMPRALPLTGLLVALLWEPGALQYPSQTPASIFLNSA